MFYLCNIGLLFSSIFTQTVCHWEFIWNSKRSLSNTNWNNPIKSVVKLFYTGHVHYRVDDGRVISIKKLKGELPAVPSATFLFPHLKPSKRYWERISTWMDKYMRMNVLEPDRRVICNWQNLNQALNKTVVNTYYTT